jgi:hypothetical protein
VRVQIEVEEGNAVVASAEYDASPEDTVERVVSNVAPRLGLEASEILLDLGAGSQRFEQSARVSDCIEHGHRWKHRRTCINVYFESEHREHKFPASSTWARVHRWACEHFHVPPDLCANLELRLGSPTGPALNEKKEVGVFAGCEVVWLVKPGPEPNGRRN